MYVCSQEINKIQKNIFCLSVAQDATLVAIIITIMITLTTNRYMCHKRF